MATLRYPGSIKVEGTKTGLISGTNYEFRVLLRNELGTATRNYTGSFSVTTG